MQIYTARASRDVVIAGHQATTRDWWDTRLSRFRAFISQIVIDEAAGGDSQAAKDRLAVLKPFPLLDIRDDASDLARDLIQSGPLPRRLRGTRFTLPLPLSMGPKTPSLPH